jgi:hypothetical protein
LPVANNADFFGRCAADGHSEVTRPMRLSLISRGFGDVSGAGKLKPQVQARRTPRVLGSWRGSHFPRSHREHSGSHRRLLADTGPWKYLV